MYRIGADGLPSEIAGSPFRDAWREPLEVRDASVWLIRAQPNFDTRNISVLEVNGTTGALTAVAGSPFRTGAAPGGLGVTPDGKFVYVTSRDEHAIYGFSIDLNGGVLTPIAGSPFATPRAATRWSSLWIGLAEDSTWSIRVFNGSCHFESAPPPVR